MLPYTLDKNIKISFFSTTINTQHLVAETFVLEQTVMPGKSMFQMGKLVVWMLVMVLVLWYLSRRGPTRINWNQVAAHYIDVG